MSTSMLTLGAAAKFCGISKGTISKAIRSGKLSATRREDGSWAINGAELARYLEVNGHRFQSETASREPSETPETVSEFRLRRRARRAEIGRPPERTRRHEAAARQLGNHRATALAARSETPGNPSGNPVALVAAGGGLSDDR